SRAGRNDTDRPALGLPLDLVAGTDVETVGDHLGDRHLQFAGHLGPVLTVARMISLVKPEGEEAIESPASCRIRDRRWGRQGRTGRGSTRGPACGSSSAWERGQR